MFNRLIIIFGFAFGSIWFAAHIYSYFWGKKKLIRTFKKVDKSNIKDCVDGDAVRIQGSLVCLDSFMVAPMTQRKCSAYTMRASIEVDRVSASGTGTHVRTETAWETLKYVEVATDFLIRCGDNYALVKTNNGSLIVHTDTTHDTETYTTNKGGFLSEQENAN